MNMQGVQELAIIMFLFGVFTTILWLRRRQIKLIWY